MVLRVHEALPYRIVLDEIDDVVVGHGGPHRREDGGLGRARVLLDEVVAVESAQRSSNVKLKAEQRA